MRDIKVEDRAPTAFPVVLEVAAETATTKSDDAVGSADRPEHAGTFETAGCGG